MQGVAIGIRDRTLEAWNQYGLTLTRADTDCILNRKTMTMVAKGSYAVKVGGECP